MFAEDEAAVLLATATGPAELERMAALRCAGHPLEQAVGWAEFCGLRVLVDPGVFVPRRRTELLAREAVALARGAVDRAAGRTADRAAHRVSHRAAHRAAHRPAEGDPGPDEPVVLDLCCGTGALGLAVATAVPGVALYAADLEPAAVRCARRNLEGRGTVLEGDLVEPLPGALRGRVDVLMANVPYVPSAEIALLPPEARLHEPRVTLDGGADGLAVLARVAALAPAWLRPGGSCLVETSDRQVTGALDLMTAHGLHPRLVEDEELGATVVVGARRRGP